jgi:hypothetical protein
MLKFKWETDLKKTEIEILGREADFLNFSLTFWESCYIIKYICSG